MTQLPEFTPRLDSRLTAEFLAHTLELLRFSLHQDDAMLDASALRFARPELPRDPDLPSLPPKAYPRLTRPLVESALRALLPPPPVEGFAGRKAELDRAVTALLTDHPVIIEGPGGTGKTALLLQIAHDPRIRVHFRRIWWLDDLSDAGVVLGLALEAPNVLITGPAEQPARLHDFLIESRALLLVDSVEGAPDGLAWALACTPHIAVIAEGGAAGAGKTVTPIALAGLAPEVAAEWLVRAAGKAENAARELAARVAHWPGALRLLAALLAEDNIPPEAIMALLEDAGENPVERLVALYRASFEALPETYQALCRSLAVSARHWVAAEQVLAAFGKPLAGQRALTFLERRGFIERRGPALRVLRGWIDAVLPAEALAEIAAAFEPLPGPADFFDPQKTDDTQSLRAASLHVKGVALLEAGDDDEAKKMLGEALTLRQAGKEHYAVAESLMALGRLAYLRGDDAAAIRELEAAARSLHALRDEEALEVVRLALSRVYRRLGRFDAALALLDDDAPPEDLAALYRARADWPEAITVYQRWIAHAEAVHDSAALAAAAYGLAETYMLAGQFADALALIADDQTFMGRWLRAQAYHLQGDIPKALALYRELQPETPTAWRAPMARALACALAASGELREAALLVGAEGVWYEAKLLRPVFARQRRSQAVYAHLCLMLGEDERADAAAAGAHAIVGERPDPEAEAIISRVLGRVAWKRGDMEAAMCAFEAELAARSALPHRDDHEVGVTLHSLADAQRALGRQDRAVANYRRALSHKDASRDRRSVLLTTLALAELLIEVGRPVEALEAGQQAVELVLRRPQADLRLLGYALAAQARMQFEHGRAPRGSAVLNDWITHLAARRDEGLAHPYWGVRALTTGLYLRSEPPVQDPFAVIDLAEQALTSAEQEAPGSGPALAARRDLGNVYLRLERWDDAHEVLMPLLEAAADAPLLLLAARLGLARAADRLGHLDEALGHYEAARDIEPDQQRRGLIVQAAAEACRQAGRDNRAADYYAEALTLLRREADLPVYIDTVVALAYTRLRLRRFGEAIDTFEEALQAVEASPRPDPALVASVLFDMATAHFTLGQYERAAATFRRALSAQDILRTPERYLETLIALARSEAHAGQHQQAVEAYHDALQFEDLSAGQRRALLAAQAESFTRIEQTQAAIDAYGAALAIDGASPVERAEIHRSLGAIYTQLGQHDLAREHFEEVLAAVQDDRTGLTLKALGDGYRVQGQLAEAINVYHRALGFLDRAGVPHERAATERALGEIYLERNQLANALAHLDTALDIERSLPQQNGGHIVSILQSVAHVHELRSELDKATLRHHEALVYQDVRHAPLPYIETLCTLGRLYIEQRRYKDAVKAYDEALRAAARLPTLEPGRVDAIRVGLAVARRAQGFLEVAADLYRQVTGASHDSPARAGAAEALEALEAEIDRHVQMLAAAEQSLQLLHRSPSPSLADLVFIRAVQAQSSAALGRHEDCEAYLNQMFDLLVNRRAEIGDDDLVGEALSLLLRGWEHETAGDTGAAQDAYRAALDIATRHDKMNPALTWAIRLKAGKSVQPENGPR